MKKIGFKIIVYVVFVIALCGCSMLRGDGPWEPDTYLTEEALREGIRKSFPHGLNYCGEGTLSNNTYQSPASALTELGFSEKGKTLWYKIEVLEDEITIYQGYPSDGDYKTTNFYYYEVQETRSKDTGERRLLLILENKYFEESSSLIDHTECILYTKDEVWYINKVSSFLVGSMEVRVPLKGCSYFYKPEVWKE